MSTEAHGPIPIELKPTSQPVTAAERATVLEAPGFGQNFTDHMVTIEWEAERGWHDGALKPYAPLSIDPANAVLHYAQSIFEGFKAYRQPDGSISTFRPDANARRMQRSARRMALPELPVETFVAAGDELVRADAAWVPEDEGKSLYVRPFMFANDVFLGVRPGRHVTFCVIASPAGAYFASGVKPVSIWVSEEYTRAATGGTGAAKCSGNYAASLVAQQEAIDNGCEQVVFLDATERKWVDELGGMNIFFVLADGSLVTPPTTTGTILEGITRDSVIQLARDDGRTVEERPVSIDEWRGGVESGAVAEVFACGTAAALTPIGRLGWRGGEVDCAPSGTGPVTSHLRETLIGIQTGTIPDPHDWVHRVC